MAKYYNSVDEAYYPIPNAKYYVLANDTFFSNWRYTNTENKIDTIVVPCNSFRETQNAIAIMGNRTTLKYIRITHTPPRTKAHVVYSLIPGWATD